MITITIPCTYGVIQRNEFKECFRKVSKCKYIRILTRPVASLVVLGNINNSVSSLFNTGLSNTPLKMTNQAVEPPEVYKLVFDMTERKRFAMV